MATNLGQAYVQIIPSAKGISGKIQNAINPESTAAGTSGGKKFSGMFKKIVAAAGLGLVIKKSIEQGAQLEQSIGGIETLFKGSADAVRKHADEAFKTTGLSANDYMENVTGFSASLLQSLGGDTKKAASISNRAMIDMADNSNKMGTAMGDIQNAYQGFAKGNYTMLDNLKLGYGGTKTEMQRLLKDAQKLSGVKYNIDNLADVYSAVGVIQDQLGITGTTALEAEETIAGSLNAMKSSFTNVLGKLAIGEDVKPSMKALASSVSTFLFKNFLPMVWNIVSALPGGVVAFIKEAVPQFIKAGGDILKSFQTGIIENAPGVLEAINTAILGAITWIQESLPSVLQEGLNFVYTFATGLFEGMPAAIEGIGEILTNMLVAIFEIMPLLLEAGSEFIFNMAQGLFENGPEIFTALTNVIDSLLKTIVEKYPEYFKKGWEIIGKMAKGLWDNLPMIISTVTDLIANLIRTISSHLPEFVGQGLLVVAQLGVGLIKAIPSIVAKIPQIVTAIINGIRKLEKAFFNIGVDLIKGLWNGINNVKDWILNKISGFVDSVMGGIKKFFGIKSPSRKMANEVGKYLPSGIALGIEANTKPLTKTMKDLSDATVTSFDANLSVGGKASSVTYTFDTNNTIENLIELISQLMSRMDKKNNEDYNFLQSMMETLIIAVSNMKVEMDGRVLGKIINDLKKRGFVT